MDRKNGILVISLDFELFWGLRDEIKLQQYRDNLLGVRKVVPALLKLFNDYGVHATWATVGLLFFETFDELISGLPPGKPCYLNAALSPYDHIGGIGRNETDDPYHYACSLIKMIISSPGQEIGSHTFSHYYCLEKGQDILSFREDLLAAVKAAKKFPALKLESIVFPRNQVNGEYMPACREIGIKAYRGNEQAWFYNADSNKKYRSFIRRGLRFIDAYVNISGYNCYPVEKTASSLPFNIPSSRFLRPYSKIMRFLEPLKLRRITKELTYAAKSGLIYHLWWHPHNFGLNIEHNLIFIEKILKHYSCLKSVYGMQSLNMKEMSRKIMDNSCYRVNSEDQTHNALV